MKHSLRHCKLAGHPLFQLQGRLSAVNFSLSLNKFGANDEQQDTVPHLIEFFGIFIPTIIFSKVKER